MLMLMLLELIIYFVPICFPHVIAFYFIFHTRKVSESDHAYLIPSLRCDLCRRKFVCIIRAVTTSREKVAAALPNRNEENPLPIPRH